MPTRLTDDKPQTAVVSALLKYIAEIECAVGKSSLDATVIVQTQMYYNKNLANHLANSIQQYRKSIQRQH